MNPTSTRGAFKTVMASPRPQPTALKLLKGETRKERLNPGEPKPQPVAPECPEWLSDMAREVWDRNVKVLERLGLLTEADGDMFAAYCDFYSKYVETSKNLGNDDVFTTDNGYEQQRPQVGMAQKYFDKARAIAIEFGLTPSARGKLTVNPGDSDDEMEGIID